MQKFETINYSLENQVATVSLNRPEKLNAMNYTMLMELTSVTEQIKKDESIKCMILRGEGRAFSSGADLSSGDRKKWKDTEEALNKGYLPIFDNIITMPKPVISSVRGAAAGIASAYSMACDLTIMSEKSYLLQPFSNIGLIPDGGSHWLLYNILGYKRAYQIAIENERISADECLRIGLANKVVIDENLEKETDNWAKKIMREIQDKTFNETYLLESSIQKELQGSYDNLEGVNAFLEKRPPKFK